MLIRIALKNLLGARLRTILNVFVTSFSFFIILLMSGMYDGMLQHAKNVTIDTEIAGGAYWHPNYDPLDPMSFEDAHAIIPNEIKMLVDQKKSLSSFGKSSFYLSWGSYYAGYIKRNSTRSEYCQYANTIIKWF